MLRKNKKKRRKKKVFMLLCSVHGFNNWNRYMLYVRE